MVFIKLHNMKQKKKSNVTFKLKQLLFFINFSTILNIEQYLPYVHSQVSQV